MRYYPDILLARQKKITEILTEDSNCPDREPNLSPLE
jgi:hypothetical protein